MQVAFILLVKDKLTDCIKLSWKLSPNIAKHPNREHQACKFLTTCKHKIIYKSKTNVIKL